MAVNAQGQFIETDNLKRSSAGFPEMNGLADYVASLETGGGAGGGGYRPGLGAQGINNVPQEQYPTAEPNLIPTNPTSDPIEEVDSLDDISDEFAGKEKPGIVDNLKKVWKAFTPNDEKDKAKYEKKKSELTEIQKTLKDLDDQFYKETRGVGGQAALEEYRRVNWPKSGYNSSTLSSGDVRTAKNLVTKHTGSDRNKYAYDDISKFAGPDGSGVQLALDENDSLYNQFLVDNDYEPLKKETTVSKENIIPFAEVHQSHKDRHGNKFNDVIKNANALNENIIQIESDGIAGAKNKKSTASGLYQFVDDTFSTAKKGYAIRHPEDTKIKNAKSAADLSASEQKNLYMDYLLTAKGSDKMLQGNMDKKDQLFWYGHNHHTKPDDATWERAFKQIYKGSVNAKLSESEKTKMRGLAQSFRNKYGKNAWGVK